jgi:hypothetical protein
MWLDGASLAMQSLYAPNEKSACRTKGVLIAESLNKARGGMNGALAVISDTEMIRRAANARNHGTKSSIAAHARLDAVHSPGNQPPTSRLATTTSKPAMKENGSVTD